MKIVSSHRLVSSREKALEKAGFNVATFPMGNGGIGQVKVMQTGEIRIQIGYGVSKHNYAKAVYFSA